MIYSQKKRKEIPKSLDITILCCRLRFEQLIAAQSLVLCGRKPFSTWSSCPLSWTPPSLKAQIPLLSSVSQTWRFNLIFSYYQRIPLPGNIYGNLKKLHIYVIYYNFGSGKVGTGWVIEVNGLIFILEQEVDGERHQLALAEDLKNHGCTDDCYPIYYRIVGEFQGIKTLIQFDNNFQFYWKFNWKQAILK